MNYDKIEKNPHFTKISPRFKDFGKVGLLCISLQISNFLFYFFEAPDYSTDSHHENARLLGAEPFNLESYNRQVSSQRRDNNEDHHHHHHHYLGDNNDDGDDFHQNGSPLSPTRSDSPTESVSSVATEPSHWQHG
jgi:hypothetical protein